jgi:CheY-like chemotaxis protein
MKRESHTILLVEDDPNDQIFIENAFRENGVPDVIHAVHNGREAIAYLSGDGQYGNRHQFEFPSFLLTDLKMPVMDGFGLLETVKNTPEWSIIPVVVLSASCDVDDIKKAYLLGAASYLTKPTNPDDLCTLLRKFHDYWAACEVPRIDPAGKQLPTHAPGKLGSRYPQSPTDPFYHKK